MNRFSSRNKWNRKGSGTGFLGAKNISQKKDNDRENIEKDGEKEGEREAKNDEPHFRY